MKAKHILLTLLALAVLAASVAYHGYFAWRIGKPVSVAVKYAGAADDGRMEQKVLSDAERERLCSLLQRATPMVFPDDTSIGAGPGLQDIILVLGYADGSSKEFTVWRNHSLLYEGDALSMRCREMTGSFFHVGGSLPAEFRDFAAPFGSFRPKEKVEEARRPLKEYLKDAATP